ncbi:CHAT domain-containing tetratricopeptide repeat protein [Sphaerisporangium dianthi]|uniref:CHAT domain-containing protein n=1 Tax=Sphaerisporangium dianthi TaxID=1436120 RepID=A0ABV9CQW8_9ACTN
MARFRNMWRVADVARDLVMAGTWAEKRSVLGRCPPGLLGDVEAALVRRLAEIRAEDGDDSADVLAHEQNSWLVHACRAGMDEATWRLLIDGYSTAVLTAPVLTVVNSTDAGEVRRAIADAPEVLSEPTGRDLERLARDMRSLRMFRESHSVARGRRLLAGVRETGVLDEREFGDPIEAQRELFRLIALFEEVLDRYERGVARALDEAAGLAAGMIEHRCWYDVRLFPRLRLLHLCANVFTYRFEDRGDEADAETSVRLNRALLEETPLDHPERAGYAGNLGNALRNRFGLDRDPADLDAAVRWLRESAAAYGQRSPHRHRALNNLGNALLDRYTTGGDGTDLDQAMAAYTLATGRRASSDPLYPTCLSNLSRGLVHRFRRDGDERDLRRAVEVARRSAQLGRGTPQRHMHLAQAAEALYEAYLRDRDPGRLREALEHVDAALAIAGPEAAASDVYATIREAVLSALAGADETTEADMDDGTGETGPAPADEAEEPLDGTVNVLARRYGRTGTGADLARLTAHLERILPAAPAVHRPVYLTSLGAALHGRFEREGDAADLHEAIARLEEAAGARGPAGPSATCLSNLGVALQSRGELTARVADLDEAVRHLRESLRRTRPGDPDEATRLSNLGNALRSRSEHTGNGADLDEAVEMGRRSVARLADEPSLRAMGLSNLGNALHVRFQRAGEKGDLDEAIAHLGRAAEAVPAGHLIEAGILSSLGNALRARFEDGGDPADIDRAIGAGRGAVAGLLGISTDRAMCRSNLAISLLARSAAADLADDDHGDGPSDGDGDGLDDAALDLAAVNAAKDGAQDDGHHDVPADRAALDGDLSEAIRLLEEAVRELPPSHPYLGTCLSNLGNALSARFLLTGDRADSDAAVAHLEHAVRTVPDGHPSQAMWLLNLGSALLSPSDDDESRTERAIRTWRTAARSRTATTSVRMAAASAWGRAAPTPAASAEGYAAAVRLLPQVAWHGLPQAARRERLADRQGLARIAAARAIECGRTAEAVELLELGRSVLWRQMLHTRGDLAVLERRAPDVAAGLARIRRLLDDLPAESAGLDGEAGRRRTVESRMSLAREWDELVERARSLDGLAHFLAPTPFAELREAAAGGPVVVVNVSAYRCDALIVTAGAEQPLLVPLPDLTLAEADRRTAGWLTALRRLDTAGRGPAALVNVRQTLTAVQEWLWNTVAGPVLDAMAPPRRDPAAGEERRAGGRPGEAAERGEALLGGPPRLWWCPTGPLSLLPLHAAGTAGGDGRWVIDEVVSSYTPTLEALRQVRRRPPAAAPRLLAVGMSHTPGLPPLPGVDGELRAIGVHRPVDTLLRDADATRDRVLSALAGHEWAHLACHGSQNLFDPAAAAVHLHDGPLTVEDLAARPLEGAELVQLSACQTAVGGVELLDEAIHLAAALHMAGYAHVVATQWVVSDGNAAALAEGVYQMLAQAGRPDAGRAALALHHAVRSLRERFRAQPDLWAPYLHIGP